MEYISKNPFRFFIGNILEEIRIISTNISCFYLLFLPGKKSGVKKCVQSILFINTGDLGDNILSFNLLTLISKSADYKCFLLTNELYKDLYYWNNDIKIFEFNKSKFKFNPFYKWRLLAGLRRFKFNIVFNITPERGIVNEELTLLSGAEQYWKINKPSPFINPLFKCFLDKKYDKNFISSSINEYNILEDVIKDLNIHKPDLPQTNSKPCICIAPFSSDKKRDWSLDSYKIIINKLSKDLGVYLFGTKVQLKPLEANIGENIILLSGKRDFKELFKVMSSAKLFIGNDSGLTHLAHFLRIPLIAIIGGGMYNRFFPHNQNRNNQYLFHLMECFGCGWNCKYKKRYCISEVKPEEVLNKAYKVLNR